jgi:hypothetical protein
MTNTAKKNHSADALSRAIGVSQKLVPKLLADLDGVEVWRFQEPGNTHYAFDLTITRFGISVHGDIGNIAFDVGSAYGLKFLAGNDVEYYMHSKLAAEFKAQEFNEVAFLDFVMDGARNRLKGLEESLDPDSEEEVDWSALDASALMARIEKLGNSKAAMAELKRKDEVSGLFDVLECVQCADLPGTTESAHAWLMDHEEALGLSDTFEVNLTRVTWSTLFKLHVVNQCAKKAFAMKDAQQAEPLSAPVRLKHCHNRAPYKDSYETHGVGRDGQHRVHEIKNVNSKSCRFDTKLTDPSCAGCRWQTEDDPRDTAVA